MPPSVFCGRFRGDDIRREVGDEVIRPVTTRRLAVFCGDGLLVPMAPSSVAMGRLEKVRTAFRVAGMVLTDMDVTDADANFDFASLSPRPASNRFKDVFGRDRTRDLGEVDGDLEGDTDGDTLESSPVPPNLRRDRLLGVLGLVDTEGDRLAPSVPFNFGRIRLFGVLGLKGAEISTSVADLVVGNFRAESVRRGLRGDESTLSSNFRRLFTRIGALLVRWGVLGASTLTAAAAAATLIEPSVDDRTRQLWDRRARCRFGVATGFVAFSSSLPLLCPTLALLREVGVFGASSWWRTASDLLMRARTGTL